MIYPRLNVVLTSQMGLGRMVVLAMEAALCGMSLIRVVWSGQFFFQSYSVFLLTPLLSSGVHWPHCDMGFYLVCWCVVFFLQHEWV